MRLNECQQVKETLAEHLGISLTVVDASQRFLDGLKGTEAVFIDRATSASGVEMCLLPPWLSLVLLPVPRDQPRDSAGPPDQVPRHLNRMSCHAHPPARRFLLLF